MGNALNIAAALNVPTFGIFGHSEPHGSLSPRIIPLMPLNGAPNFNDGMWKVSPDQVLDAVSQRLNVRDAQNMPAASRTGRRRAGARRGMV